MRVLLPSAGVCHVSMVRAPAPLASLAVRLVEPTDVTQLCELTTSSLYGEADLFKVGPIIAMQRQQIVQKQRAILERRVGFEGTDAECRFYVAVEQTDFGDRICGCVDCAVHLFDEAELRFFLNQSTMPEGGEGRYRWSPYMASVAVSRPYRGTGVGRQLVRTAESWAKQEGYGEMMLEVSQLNSGAIAFYERLGYSTVSSFAQGEAGGGGEIITRKGVRWEVEPTGKHILRRALR
jgi:ribosomal protein S18 acetylase RimI-like enzyme